MFVTMRHRLKKKNSITERRRVSRGFKKRQFQLRRSQFKKWRAGLKVRRAVRAAQHLAKKEKENILPLFEKKRKRQITTALDCPLDTCPKKLRLMTQLRRLERSTEDESDDNFSVVTHISNQSARSRTPLRIVRRN